MEGKQSVETQNPKRNFKIGKIQNLCSSPGVRETLDPEIQKNMNSLKFHEIGRCSNSSSVILHFPSSKKSIPIYVLKHKRMLQIDFGPKR